MASIVSDMWSHVTVLIENEWAEKGTGFFVSRDPTNSRRKYFVVTAKHNLYNEAWQRSDLSEVHLHVNVKTNGQIIGEQVTLPLTHENGEHHIWQEHPEQDVDVVALDVTHLIDEREDLEHKAASYENLADANRIKEEQILPGDDVVVVGYPKGIRQGDTNYPVFRQGMLATRIEEELHEDIAVNSHGTTVYNHTPRGFLIDGAIIKGLSGSPVILKPFLQLSTEEDDMIFGHANPLILGVIAQTRDAPRVTPTGHIESHAGLALAFDADTIRETVELFF